MGETKKRRQTKHRGNAAGMVEARGRGNRGVNSVDLAGQPSSRAPKPASWNRAVVKALIPVAILIPLLLVMNQGKSIGQVLGLCAIAFVMYVPLSYFTDRYMYARWLKKTGQTT